MLGASHLDSILQHEVDVIGCHSVIEHTKSKALLLRKASEDNGGGLVRTSGETSFDGSDV